MDIDLGELRETWKMMDAVTKKCAIAMDLRNWSQLMETVSVPPAVTLPPGIDIQITTAADRLGSS